MHPTISVIIPAYNAQNTLERAINCALQQTYPPKEIIVINDGSSDDTEVVAQRFGSNIIYRRQNNAGAASARNHGAQLASGDLIAFLDADDAWHKCKLELHVNAFGQIPEAGLCWNTGYFFTEESYDPLISLNNLPENENTKPIRKLFREIFVSPHLGTPNVVMKRALFESLGGFDTALMTAEDTDLWLRACHAAQAIYIPAHLSYVIVQASSLSSNYAATIYESHLNVVQRFCQTHKEFSRNHPIVIRHAKAKTYEKWGSQALSTRKLPLAREKLIRSIFLYPRWRAIYLLLKTLALSTYNTIGGKAETSR